MIKLRLTWVLISSLLLASCVTQKACLEKYPPRDTTYVAYQDTIYFVSVTSDTVLTYGTIFDTIHASTGLAGGQAWLNKDTIFLNVWQKDTVIQYRDSIQVVYKEKIVTVKEKTVWSDIRGTASLIGVLVLIGLLFIIIIKLIK
jgi:hypothetical protein